MIHRLILLIATSLALLQSAARAADQTTFNVPGPAQRFLIVPAIEVDGSGNPIVPLPGSLTATDVWEAVTLGDLITARPALANVTTGSVQDYWSTQWPGTVLTGLLQGGLPGDDISGFTRVHPPGISAPTEAETLQRVSILLNRLGYGRTPINNPLATVSSPAQDAAARNNVSYLVLVMPTASGWVRDIDGVPVAGMGCAEADYGWLGVAVHEFGHRLGIGMESYATNNGGSTPWDVMADAYGAFPGGLPAWVRHRQGMGRIVHSVRRGRSDVTLLPAHGFNTGALPEFLMLDNGTIAANGTREFVFGEFRKARAGTSPLRDVARMAFTAGTADGLLVSTMDRSATGWFYGGSTAQNFSRAAGVREDYAGNPLRWTDPISGYKAASGNLWSGALYTPSAPLTASAAGDGNFIRSRSSANGDGNAVWQVVPTGVAGDLLGVNINFQGRPISLEAAEFGTWSANTAQPMLNQTSSAPQGWYFRETTGTGPVTGFPETLRFFSNRAPGSAFRTAVQFPHCVHRNGEVMVFGALRDHSAGAVNVPVTMVITVSTPEGAGIRRMDRTLNAAPGFFEYSHIDLTEAAGQSVLVKIECSATEQFGVGMGEAWFFRKGDPVRADPGNRLSRLPGNPELTAASAGPATGFARNVAMEDGVTYDRCLAMAPGAGDAGAVTAVANDYTVPASGGLLRGSVGFAASATPVSDGATLRVEIDDRIRRWPLFRPVETQTLLAHSSGTFWNFEAPVIAGLGVGWTSDPEWKTGDLLLAGDVNGDAMADLVVVTPDAPRRILVYQSNGTGFNAPTKYSEGWVQPGDRVLLANLDGTGGVEVVRIAADGSAETARRVVLPFPPGALPSFDPAGVTLTDLARGPELVLAGRVAGSSRDDLIVCTMESISGAGAGRPARNLGTARVAVAGPGGTLAAPVLWTGFGPNGGDTPMIADLSGDGLDDLVWVSADGTARSMTSSGTSFPGFGGTTWFTGGPTHSAADPVLPPGSPNAVFPGIRYTTGSILQMGKVRQSGGSILWGVFEFVRSASPFEIKRGDVIIHYTVTGPRQTYVLPEPVFGLGSDWPLVADFGGDGSSDAMVTAPTLIDNAPLYISPRPAGDYGSAVSEASAAFDTPRLNRFTADLSPYAGRTISVSISVHAGPNSAAGDVVFFPEVKYYGAESTLPPEVPPQLVIEQAGPGIVRVRWPIDSCFQRLQFSDNLSAWFNETIPSTTAGSFRQILFPTTGFPKQFWRLLPQ